MDGRTEDTYLLDVSARTKPAPKRATLAQLAEQRLGSLQYLLASSKSSTTSSPPSRSTARPRASTVTAARGATTSGSEAKRVAGRVRRFTGSAIGDLEEARTPPRDRSQGSSVSGGSSRARGNSKTGVYRLSIGNQERAPVGGTNSSGKSATANDAHRSRSSDSSLRVEQKGRRRSPHSSERGIAGAREVVGRAAPRQQVRRGGQELSPAGAAAAAVGDEATAGGTVVGHTPDASIYRKFGGGSGAGGDGDGGGGAGALGVPADGGHDDDHGEERDSCLCYSDDTEDGQDEDEGAYLRSRRRRRLLQNGGCLAVGLSWTVAVLLLLLLCVGGGGEDSAAAAGGGGGAASLEIVTAACCALLGAVLLATLACFFGVPTWRYQNEEGQEEDREDEEGRDVICCCCFWGWWGSGREGTDEKGGKLAEIGGITYLAI